MVDKSPQAAEGRGRKVDGDLKSWKPERESRTSFPPHDDIITMMYCDITVIHTCNSITARCDITDIQ